MEFVDLNENARILDYGCGFGPLGLSFANIAGIVFLLDSTIERCSFAQRRAVELGFSNTVGVVTGDWKSLPIENRSLDLIILNGVLEWIPETAPGNPLEVQLDFIESMKKLLREDGAVFIGIENRFALRHFRGYRDDHTNTAFTPIMPRRLANLYCRWRIGKPYRTLTWSYREYNRNLSQLGFRKIDFIYLHPDYRFPKKACFLNDISAVHKIRSEHLGPKAKLIASMLFRLRILHFFLYSYGIVAYV